jgi:hypothetical protein
MVPMAKYNLREIETFLNQLSSCLMTSATIFERSIEQAIAAQLGGEDPLISGKNRGCPVDKKEKSRGSRQKASTKVAQPAVVQVLWTGSGKNKLKFADGSRFSPLPESNSILYGAVAR